MYFCTPNSFMMASRFFQSSDISELMEAAADDHDAPVEPRVKTTQEDHEPDWSVTAKPGATVVPMG